MINFEKFLIAPNSSRNYLIYKYGMNLVCGVVFCFMYIDQFFAGQLPFGAAYFRSSLLFLLCIIHMCYAVLYVLLIPQLITLYQSQRRNDQIQQLKQFLKYKLNQYLQILNIIKNSLFVIGIVFAFWDLLTKTEPDTENIIKFVRYYSFVGFCEILILRKLENILDADIVEESQKCYIKSNILTESSQILKDDCPICYDQFKVKDVVAEYQCEGKHKFHKVCVVNWLKADLNKKKNCPYCKMTPNNL